MGSNYSKREVLSIDYCVVDNTTVIPETTTELIFRSVEFNGFPTLPNGLKNLTIDDCNLKSGFFEYLPDKLFDLSIYKSGVVNLPDLSHLKLDCLMLVDNEIKSIETWPKYLRQIFIPRNGLTKIPAEYPKNVEEFDCAGNQLTEIPLKLPKSLGSLHCENNNLITNPEHIETLKWYKHDIYSVNDSSDRKVIDHWRNAVYTNIPEKYTFGYPEK